MAQISCRYCAKAVETRRPTQILCGSDDCKRLYLRDAMAQSRARRPKAAHLCAECGAEFTPEKGRRGTYCSPDCMRSAHLRGRRDREYQPTPLKCDHCCGAIPYKSGKRRYCSPECQKAGIAKEARWRVKGLPPSMVMPTSCALCGESGRRLVIDHDHSCCPQERACGRCFRGMLCQPCNVALGMLKEDPTLLRRAAEYIENAKLRLA